MPNKFYSLPKSVFEHYHAKIKDWVRAVLPTKTSDLTNDSDFLDQLALAGIIAVTFSASSKYEVGDYVLYNHTLYRCKTAITTAGAWDASKWDAAKTQDIFKGSAPGLVPTPTAQDVANKNMLAADGTFVPHQDLSEYIKEVNLGDIVAEVFSTSKTYAVGDYVIHEKKLHRCTTAVQTAGDWSSSNWTQVKSTDIFQGSAPGLVPAAESGDADKVLKGDGTWGVVSGGSGGSTARVSYDAQTEELHLDFSPPPADSVLIGDRYYHYVKVGNLLWIDENLEYLPSGLTLGTDAFYYNNVRQDKHGLLYKPISCFNAIENSIPNGWRIATKSDVTALVNIVGSNNASKLRATSEWVGTVTQSTDEYGLSIIPTGYWWSDQGFIYGGSRFTCWTSTRASESADSGWCRLYIDHGDSINILDSGMYVDNAAYSIRLVKDVT